MATKTRATTKKVKKGWYNILATKEFNEFVIGKTITKDKDGNNLIGRTLWLNLATLTNDPKTQNVKVRLRINNIKENNAYTEFVGYEIMPPYIKRVVKAGRNKVDDSFVCETKDKLKIRIKPLLLTKNKTNKSVLTDLRKKTREFFNRYCSREEYIKIVNDLITHKLQNDLRKTISKVYPLRISEIRSMRRI